MYQQLLASNLLIKRSQDIGLDNIEAYYTALRLTLERDIGVLTDLEFKELLEFSDFLQDYPGYTSPDPLHRLVLLNQVHEEGYTLPNYFQRKILEFQDEQKRLDAFFKLMSRRKEPSLSYHEYRQFVKGLVYYHPMSRQSFRAILFNYMTIHR